MIWPVKKPAPGILPSLPALELSTARLMLRPPRRHDWAQWAVVRGDNQAALTAWEPTWPEECLSEAFFIRRLRRQARDWQAGAAYSFLVFHREDDVLIGGINLNHVAHGAARSASLGYWLDHDYQRSGYMREALEAVIQWAFNELQLHRVNAACLPTNTPSINVLRRLGFEEEGFARSYYRINGQWENHILFGRINPVE